MSIMQGLTLLIFLAVVVMLVTTNLKPAKIFGGSALLLVLTQQISTAQLLTNATNPGLVALVLLLLASQVIEKTAFLKRLGLKLVTRDYTQSFFRLVGFSFISSAFLNNTAIVASLLNSVKQNGYHAPSKLLIPLSFAAILGGTVTLIGTSTNLIVDSFLRDNGHPGFDFFDFTTIGLIAGTICILVLYGLSHLLPIINDAAAGVRLHFIEADVSEHCELIGKTVEQNHLRNLPELFLVEIIRGSAIIPATPDTLIQAHDKLVFNGNVKRLDGISHIKGLELFAETNGLLRDNLTDVIISNRATVVGKTLKSLGFRSRFDAAVVAIRRDGQHLSGKLGDIKLQAGDFLTLAVGPDFYKHDNVAKNFFVVSAQRIQTSLAPWQEFSALAGFVITVTLAAVNAVPLVTGLLFLLAGLSAIGIFSLTEIRRALPLNLIIIIVGALSLASALEQSGLMQLLANGLNLMSSGLSPFMLLLAIYVSCLLLTEFVTNNAAAALMFPFAYAMASAIEQPILPYALAVAFAASASFISPYGYQTNLLVFNAISYRFWDFARIGIPMSVTYSALVLFMIRYLYFG